jgi:hypothetical protein
MTREERSLHGEHQLADVLAGEQPGQGVRECVNAGLEDVSRETSSPSRSHPASSGLA